MNALDKFMLDKLKYMFPPILRWPISWVLLILVRNKIIPFHTIEYILPHVPSFTKYKFVGSSTKGHDLKHEDSGHKIEIKTVTNGVPEPQGNNGAERIRFKIGNMDHKECDLLVVGYDTRSDKIRYYGYKSSEYKWYQKTKNIGSY